jgi:hypothetical protein
MVQNETDCRMAGGVGGTWRHGGSGAPIIFISRGVFMKHKRLFILLTVVFLLSSCATPSPSSIHAEDISLSINRTDLRAFTISSGGELYAIPAGGALTQLSHEGDEIKTYPGTDRFFVLHAHGQYIYAYDGSRHRFVRMNPDNGDITDISGEVIPDDIRNIVVAGDTLYALLVLPCRDGHHNCQATHNFSINEDGYMDWGERLYAINIRTGEMADTGIDNVIAIYAGVNEKLYYYAYIDDRYGLYSYSRGKSEKLYETDEIGYVFSFIFENDTVVVLSGRDSSVRSRDMSNGQEIRIYNDFFVMAQNDIQYYAGNVILLRTHFIEAAEQSIHSEMWYFSMLNPLGDSTGGKTNTVTIKTHNDQLLNTDNIHALSGITVSYIKPPASEMEELAQFMAGEPDVDIYINYSTTFKTQTTRSKGIFVPLGDSEIISSYLGGCFDYIADYAHTSSGDVWMLPLYGYLSVLFYVPENFDKFGLTIEDIQYFDGFIETVKRLNKESEEFSVYIDSPPVLMFDLQSQYEKTYNYYADRVVDFNTELFTRIFSTIWSGWSIAENTRHPFFRNSYDDRANAWFEDHPSYDKDKVIFKLEHFNEHFRYISIPIDGWRVLPLPRISENVSGNILSLQYAAVNPLSRNKEAAAHLLETIAASPLETISMDTLLLKDPEVYAKRYDISQLGFRDLLRIFQNGAIKTSAYPQESYDYINDFQAGRLTAEEAVMVLQREVEMWLNE